MVSLVPPGWAGFERSPETAADLSPVDFIAGWAFAAIGLNPALASGWGLERLSPLGLSFSAILSSSYLVVWLHLDLHSVGERRIPHLFPVSAWFTARLPKALLSPFP